VLQGTADRSIRIPPHFKIIKVREQQDTPDILPGSGSKLQPGRNSGPQVCPFTTDRLELELEKWRARAHTRSHSDSAPMAPSSVTRGNHDLCNPAKLWFMWRFQRAGDYLAQSK
jgi:hypothetical protein